MAELSGQGPIGFHSGATSLVDSSAGQKLGMRGVDVDGNIYVYVDFQQALSNGELVKINSDFTVVRASSTSRGWVGVVVATVSASDRFGWVQVYGVNSFVWATSNATTAGNITIGVTTDLGHVSGVSTSDDGIAVHGIHLATAPDTCASTALSTSALAAPATAILNFPFISGTVSVATT
jgi:hypothetical protein